MGTPSFWYFRQASKMGSFCAFREIFCKVAFPRSDEQVLSGGCWQKCRRHDQGHCPRREPYELKSLGCTPCCCQEFSRRAVSRDITGREMLSVLTESPNMARPAPLNVFHRRYLQCHV